MARSSDKTKKTAKKEATKPVAEKAKKKVLRRLATQIRAPETPPPPLLALGPSASVLDRLHGVVLQRQESGDTANSHSARLLARGTAKVAQKFGEESVECLIEAVRGDRHALIGESADVLYHLIVLWVNAGITPAEVWTELQKREGISGITEKASRPKAVRRAFGVESTKIP